MRRRWWGEDPGLRLVALVVAVLLWFVAQGEQQQRETAVAKVEWVLPPGLVLLSDDPLPDSVVVVASGPRVAARRLPGAELRYVVDLRNVEPGRTLHAFRGPPAGLPDGLYVETVSPAMVELGFDEPHTRTLPVELVTRGELPIGWREQRRSVRPDSVTVIGARKELATLEALRTRPLNLADRRGTWKGRLPLDLAGLHLGAGGPTEVEVELELTELSGRRSVELTLSAPSLPPLEPPRVTVELSGPVPVLESLASAGLSWTPIDAAGEVPDRWALVRPEDEEPGVPALRLAVDHPRAGEVRIRSIEPLWARFRAPDPPEEPKR